MPSRRVALIFTVFLALAFGGRQYFSIGLTLDYPQKKLAHRTNAVSAIQHQSQCFVTATKNEALSTEAELPENFAQSLSSPKPKLKCGENGMQSPWKLNRHAWMTFVIKSSRKNRELRDVVRQTWGSVQGLGGKFFGYVFVVGMDGSAGEELEIENSRHGDILECDIIETYRNLPLKMMGAFTWITKQRHMTTKFISVTDDDCVINSGLMREEFGRHQFTDDGNRIYCGFKYEDEGRPARNNQSKWHIPKELFPNKFFPGFCHGALWSLTPKIIEKLVCVFYFTEINGFHLEDVLITGILRRKIGGNITTLQTLETENLLAYHTGKKRNPAKVMREKWKEWKPEIIVGNNGLSNKDEKALN